MSFKRLLARALKKLPTILIRQVKRNTHAHLILGQRAALSYYHAHAPYCRDQLIRTGRTFEEKKKN